jgi:hypothetical protein
VLAKRPEIVGKLNDAKELLGKSDDKGALVALTALRAEDPLGAATALTLSRAALATGDPALAASAARVAIASAAGRSDLVADAHVTLAAALEKLGRPREALLQYEAAENEHSSPAAKKAVERLRKDAAEPLTKVDAIPERRVADPKAACDALEADAKANKLELAFSTLPVEEAHCSVDFTLDVKAKELARAIALRLDVVTTNATERAEWVVLEDAKGGLLHGPVASVFGAKGGAFANDVVVDLQQIDVLPGGSPELVVKITERRTLPDVALGESVEVDRTQAVLLTLDRGPLQASREVVLSSRIRRDRIGKPGAFPHGFGAAKGLGTTAEYSMKVAWNGANSMSLTKASGSAKPAVEGSVTLFP